MLKTEELTYIKKKKRRRIDMQSVVVVAAITSDSDIVVTSAAAKDKYSISKDEGKSFNGAEAIISPSYDRL